MRVFAVVAFLLLGGAGAALAQGIAGLAVGPDENTYILWYNTSSQGISVRVESINSFNGSVVQQGTFSSYFPNWQLGGYISSPQVYSNTLAVGPNDDVQVGAISNANDWLSIWHFTNGTYNGATTFGQYNPVPGAPQILDGVAIDDSDNFEFLTCVPDPNQQYYYEATQQSYVATTGTSVSRSTLDREMRPLGTAITNSGLRMMFTTATTGGASYSVPFDLMYPIQIFGNWEYAGPFYSMTSPLQNPLEPGDDMLPIAVTTTSNGDTQIYFNGFVGGNTWDLVIEDVNSSGVATESPAFSMSGWQPEYAAAYALPLSKTHGNNTDLEVAWFGLSAGGYKIETINPSNWTVVGTFTP